MPHDPAISVTGLRKAYDDHTVLDGLDLDIPSGSVFALLGPNGAGKTTAVQVLSTLIPRDGGAVRVAGCDLDTDPDGIRAAIGVTGQFSAVDGLLTGRENLRLMADLNHLPRGVGRSRAAALLDRFDLGDAADRSAATYSGGMRRRLDLAMTLVGAPSVIFLDEPTTGLDPRSRRRLWAAVRELVADGVTVFLTTQYLEEADQLADEIAVLDHGRLVARGTPAQLKALVPGAHLRVGVADADDLDAAVRALPLAGDARRDGPDGPVLDIPTDGGVATLRDVLARLDAADVHVTALTVRTPDLDDVFLALTGTAPDPAPTGVHP